MKFVKFMVLCIGLTVGGYQETHAELTKPLENNGNTTIVSTPLNVKENKTVIELNKDITVNTGLNLDKTLSQLKGTEASFKPKVRKVTPVDNDGLEDKQVKANGVNSTVANVTITTTTTTTTTQAPTQVTKILAEGGAAVVLEKPAKNDTEKVTVATTESKNATEKTLAELKPKIISEFNKTETTIINSKNSNELNKQTNVNSTTNITTPTTSTTTSTTTSPITTTTLQNTNATKANNVSTTIKPTISTVSLNSTSSTTSTKPTTTTTTTTTSTTTTTTTTTPKPKKPTITYSIPDFPDLEKDNPELNTLLQSSASASDGPYAQPSQEFTNNSFHRGRDFILPIVSMIFIIPLVIGIMITSYRRFRDCWSTRHYRRMDFLVDGMYND